MSFKELERDVRKAKEDVEIAVMHLREAILKQFTSTADNGTETNLEILWIRTSGEIYSLDERTRRDVNKVLNRILLKEGDSPRHDKM